GGCVHAAMGNLDPGTAGRRCTSDARWAHARLPQLRTDRRYAGARRERDRVRRRCGRGTRRRSRDQRSGRRTPPPVATWGAGVSAADYLREPAADLTVLVPIGMPLGLRATEGDTTEF